MKSTITYNVCRENLGDDTSDAQYDAYKLLAQAAIESAFPGVDVEVGDSDFCNASTIEIDQRDNYDQPIMRDDVEEAVSRVGEEWWGAE